MQTAINLHSLLLGYGVGYPLLIMSILCFIFEILTPGIGIMGFLGFLFLGIFVFTSPPIYFMAYIFTVIGISFILFEVFISSSGLFFLVGLFNVILGLIASFKAHFSRELMTPLITLAVILIFLCSLFYLGLRKVFTLRRKESTFFTYVNREGEVVADFKDKRGMCKIEGTLWKCTANETLTRGEKIVVVSVEKEGTLFRVQKIKE